MYDELNCARIASGATATLSGLTCDRFAPLHTTGPSGFGSASTAEEVAAGFDGRRKTIIITGASAGLGAEATRVGGCRVIIMPAADGVHQAACKAQACGPSSKQYPPAHAPAGA